MIFKNIFNFENLENFEHFENYGNIKNRFLNNSGKTFLEHLEF